MLIILNNFISNSRRQDATEVQIAFEEKDNELIIKISDNSGGGGVKDKDAQYIFNRAYTTTKGAGVGLYDVKKILREMSGRVKFIGNNLEEHLKGACFEIKIRK